MIKAKSERGLAAGTYKLRRAGSDEKCFAKERLIENADRKNADWGELGDIVQRSRSLRQLPRRSNSDEKLFTKLRSQNADRGELGDAVQRSRAARQRPRRANSDENLFAKLRLQKGDGGAISGDAVQRSRAARQRPRRANSDENLFAKLRLQKGDGGEQGDAVQRSRAARQPPRRASSDEQLFTKEQAQNADQGAISDIADRSRSAWQPQNANREDISSIAGRSRAAWKPRRRASCGENLCARERLVENTDKKNADWGTIGDGSQPSQTTEKPVVNSRQLIMKAKSERYLGGRGSKLYGRQHSMENTSKRNFDLGEISGIADRSGPAWQPLDKADGPVPSMPKRLLSPLGKKVLLKNSFRHIKLPDEDEMSDSSGCDSDCDPDCEPSQILPVSGAKQDLRAVLLDRIPAHIKEQLSLNEWNKILEPAAASSKQNEAAEENDDCSDILHGFTDIASPRSQRKAKVSPPQKRDKAFDALYCTENGGRAESPNQKPRIKEESKMEQPARRTSVSFGEVQVRSYERILEVHPCTSAGPSLGIGWEYTESSESIDWSNSSGDSDDIRLSRDIRERMVKDLGYSSRDVAYAVREGLRIKNQRRRTINNLKASIVNIEKVECMVEKCNRKLKKLQSKYILAGAA